MRIELSGDEFHCVLHALSESHTADALALSKAVKRPARKAIKDHSEVTRQLFERLMAYGVHRGLVPAPWTI